METYAYTLLRNIGKVFQLPHYKSAQYSKLEKELVQLMNQVKSGQIDRQRSIEILTQLIGNFKRLPSREGRAEERISVIVELLKSRNYTPRNILDLGAGNGEITVALKNYYNLPTESVFAIDQKLPTIKSVTPLTYIDGKIPLPDNSIDLIIIFVVLHHIPPDARINIMKEISRVLSPNGFVIIREHDDDKTDEFYIFLDLIHLFWYFAFEETPDPLYLLSRNETHELFANVGLIPVAFNTYDNPNPQHLYHEMYTKKPVGLSYQFIDTQAQLALQNYINTIKLSPHTYESFLTVIPPKLQPDLISKYNINSNTNLDIIWANINKDTALALILVAVKSSNLINGIYYISAADINLAIQNSF